MGVGADLTGRRVLVTGASSGIGAATCRSIVGCGGSVAMLARRQERLDELHEELGGRAVPVSCDVTDFALLESAIGEGARLLNGLDGLIAVAGRTVAGSITTGTPERWREVLDLNLVAPLATARFGVGHFPPDGRRDVVLVGSAGGITPMPGAGIYAASKRGLRAAFDALRLELAPSGVNVGLVMPGMFETEGLTLDGLLIDGEIPPNDIPLFVPGTGPAPADAVAEAIAFMIGLPCGVGISELVVRPTGELHP